MATGLVEVGVLLTAYVALILFVGIATAKKAATSPEEYFLAGRALGTPALFAALFGAHLVAFVFIGVPGRAYHDGIGVFSTSAPLAALVTPLTFWLVGAPAHRMARARGAITPAQLYARRLDSPLLGFVLCCLFTAYTVPYMVALVVGAATSLAGATGGAIAPWLGGLGVVAVTLYCTGLGGMRATAWTSGVHGAVVLGFLALAVVLVAADMGGPEAAIAAVRDHDPTLLALDRSELHTPPQFISWGFLMALTAIACPHLLVRLMAARSEAALKGVCRVYPLALLLLWLPPVLIGVWGRTEFTGLSGSASDGILPLMLERHLSPALAALGLVALLGAALAGLDAMILTTSSMLVRDVLGRIRPYRGQRAEVSAGRLFGLAVGAAVYGLAQWWGSSVFEVASAAFSGYVTLTPTLFFGVRWQRFTARAALASLGAGTVVLYGCRAGWLPLVGFLPVFWGFGAALVTAVVVTLLSGTDTSEPIGAREVEASAV